VNFDTATVALLLLGPNAADFSHGRMPWSMADVLGA
jgi:hypothetical protein